MPNRNYSSPAYRYGFNTQEKVDDISGEGNHFSAQYWEYNPRIGRRWNLDPVKVSWESGYAVNRNNPILYSDPNGDDPDKSVKKHKTVKGDTYEGLAKKYGVSVNNLREWNKFKDKSIPVGVELNVSDPNVIALSVNKPGTGDDMGSGNLSNLDVLKKIGTSGSLQRRQQWSNSDLENDMMDLGMKFADSPKAKAMVKDLFNHFFNGSGSNYSSNLLTEAVKNHPSTKRFIHNQIIPTFQELVDKNNGYLEGGFDLKLKGNPRFNETGFLGFGSGDEDNGLRISINDVWGYRVRVVNYQEIEGRYSAQIQLTLYDHFGLNDSDITEHNYSFFYPGFYSWYILQWQKGYKPFVTVVPINIEIKGTLKK